MKVKLKRKAAFLLAVVIMFTTAFVFPDFSYQSFAEETEMAKENTEILPEEITEESTENVSEESLDERYNDSEEETGEVNTSETTSEELTTSEEETSEEETSEETSNEEENTNDEKIIGDIQKTKLFSIKNDTGRKIISFNIIENKQSSASNMLSEDFEVNEERTVYFNYVSDKDYDLVLKYSDGNEVIVYSFDIKDMLNNVSNPESKVLLKLDGESQTTYLKYGTKSTLDDEKLLQEEDQLLKGEEDGNSEEENDEENELPQASDAPNDVPVSETNRVVNVDTSLSDEDFHERYGLTKDEYFALVNGTLPNSLASSTSENADDDELIEEENLLGANGTYSVESMDTPPLWGTVGMIAQMQDSDGNKFPDADTHALCINHQLDTDHGTEGVTYTISSIWDYGISLEGARLLIETYYYTYGDGQAETASRYGLDDNGVHALGSFTASYIVNGSASVGSTIAGHCADFVAWMQSNDYEFRVAGDEVNDNLTNSAQTNISTVSTDSATNGMYKSDTMVFTTTGGMVYYTIVPANCVITVTYPGGTTDTAVGGQQIFIANNANLTIYADPSLSETTTNLTFNVVNDAAHIPHQLHIFTPSNNAKQPLFAPQWSFPHMYASVSWAGKGNIRLVKTSSNTTFTNNNSCYSLEGAVYGVYGSQADANADTNRVTTITTGADGTGTSDDLTLGTYYVKEITASKGYSLDATVHTATVSSTVQSPVVSSSEKPKGDPANIAVVKKGSTKRKPVEGAIFEVKYYATENSNQLNNTTYRRHWYLKTDSDGKGYLDSNYLTTYNGNSSDEFYLSEIGNPALPLGYITVQEVYAPTGYILDNTIHTYPTTDTDTNTSVENQRTVTNDEWSQPFEFTKYGNDGVSILTPLPNAGFMIWNIENLTTDAEGNYVFDKNKAEVLTASGDKEIFTDADGKAKTIPLVYGSYIVKETTTPPDYLPCADFPISVTVNKPTEAQQKAIVDTPIHYYLRIVKKDITTGKPILNKKSSYKIFSYAKNDYVSFRTHDGSSFVMQDEFTTNDESILVLPEPLKAGRYKIYETVSPEGYNVDSPEGIDFTIDGNTAYETYEIPGDTAVIGLVTVDVTDTPIYGKYEIEKTGEVRTYDDTTGEFVTTVESLENIEFGIYAAENIYSADGNNTLLFSKGDLAYTLITDANGKASHDNIPLGKYTVKELNTPDDFVPIEDTDIEFNEADKKLDANGKYYVEQKSEFLNKSYYPKVKTTALDSKTNEHTGVIGTTVTVVDKVDCSDMVIGREYTIKGILYDTTTKKPYVDNAGKNVTAEKTFTATAKNQTVNLEFTYDTTDLKGETITVFETMYHNNKVVAVHADISDTEQQVHYPDVKTTALDSKTNTHTGVLDEKVTVVDKVACTNLIVGKEYTVKGKLYNTETGGVILENGKEITATKTFKAEEVNPVIDLEFTLNSKTLAGETIVVFEDLYVNDIKVATHSDLEDENQQVSYPTVGTKAVDKDTDSKSGVTGEVATIVDTVDCKNLVIGQVYTVKGKLYDTKSGEVFLDNGKEVTAEKTFVAIKKDMSVDLEFVFDSSALEGKTTTVFEDLYNNGIKVASHSDLDDKDQQVDYPKVKTTAKDKATDTHTGIKSETATIIDTVSCTNLVIGKEYTVKGKLYNTETGEVFLDNGKEVTAEKTFKADKNDMTVELEFTFNSTSLEAETIVVFEDLYHKGIKVDTHNRLDDKDQQVHYPKIGTTAKNPVDGGKIAKPNKNVKLNDTVDVKSVAAGDKFVLRGVIYDKATGEKLLINGTEVWSEATLVAPDNDFKTDVIFTFDASSLAGKNIVVFEYLYLVKEDGTEILVASHEDINDEGQSIKFSTEPKTGDRGFIQVFLMLVLSFLMMMVLVFVKRYIINNK